MLTLLAALRARSPLGFTVMPVMLVMGSFFHERVRRTVLGAGLRPGRLIDHRPVLLRSAPPGPVY
jgi:hypothetical protein